MFCRIIWMIMCRIPKVHCRMYIPTYLYICVSEFVRIVKLPRSKDWTIKLFGTMGHLELCTKCTPYICLGFSEKKPCRWNVNAYTLPLHLSFINLFLYIYTYIHGYFNRIGNLNILKCIIYNIQTVSWRFNACFFPSWEENV